MEDDLEKEHTSASSSPLLAAWDAQSLLHPTYRRSLLYSTAWSLHSCGRSRPAAVPSAAPAPGLDGLRGVACFFVAIGHYTSIFSTFLPRGYGVDGDNRYLMQLPVLNLVFQGAVMVNIFFVISGVALSIKPLHHIRQHQHDRVLAALSSTTLRRFFRLYLPVFAATLALALTTWAGFFEPGRAARAAFPDSIQGPADAPPRLPLGAQLSGWFDGCVKMVKGACRMNGMATRGRSRSSSTPRYPYSWSFSPWPDCASGIAY
ncbi:hypothetical protein NLG97_g1440 [Lecanicillium saksenae]|uniref:Uncharacterized protein n=1 Tax=Lecanicillium saksenae TaxID=468837 RepID=A0ACC1R5I1_9HYPO|nr:hypothetical protein NLG97_g1440 [Lecanicillium saksenae]